MRLRWREMFTSKVDAAVRWYRWDFVALALAMFIAVWVLALKLKTFYNLGYSSDLFTSVQAARTFRKAVRRSRLAIRAGCFGGSGLPLGDAYPASSRR